MIRRRKRRRRRRRSTSDVHTFAQPSPVAAIVLCYIFMSLIFRLMFDMYWLPWLYVVFCIDVTCCAQESSRGNVVIGFCPDLCLYLCVIHICCVLLFFVPYSLSSMIDRDDMVIGTESCLEPCSLSLLPLVSICVITCDCMCFVVLTYRCMCV